MDGIQNSNCEEVRPVTVSTALTPDLKSDPSDSNGFWPIFIHDVDVVADHGRAVVNVDLARKSLRLQHTYFFHVKQLNWTFGRNWGLGWHPSQLQAWKGWKEKLRSLSFSPRSDSKRRALEMQLDIFLHDLACFCASGLPGSLVSLTKCRDQACPEASKPMSEWFRNSNRCDSFVLVRLEKWSCCSSYDRSLLHRLCYCCPRLKTSECFVDLFSIS